MRMNSVDSIFADEDQLLTTGEAAKILGTSRQHVVDLCERGELPFVTTGEHRRVRRSDVEEFRSRSSRLSRDQRKSLWLGYAIAGKVVLDPPSAMTRAKVNLKKLQKVHSTGVTSRWLKDWERLLNGPLDDVLETLTSRSPRARELRQNSPFSGVLTQRERTRVLERFASPAMDS